MYAVFVFDLFVFAVKNFFKDLHAAVICLMFYLHNTVVTAMYICCGNTLTILHMLADSQKNIFQVLQLFNILMV